jgi:acetyl-CoA carboxylase biotin carboxyl carrier protein
VAEALEQRDVEELLSIMEQWGVAELHLQMDDLALDLVRATYALPTETVAAPHVLGVPTQVSEPVAPAGDEVIVRAPVVGVFHLATRGFPKGCPLPGDAVQAGQVIGSIELMHVPSDLVSPTSGTIVAVLAEDGRGVEYGQPLLAIRPGAEVSEDEAGMLPPSLR